MYRSALSVLWFVVVWAVNLTWNTDSLSSFDETLEIEGVL